MEELLDKLQKKADALIVEMEKEAEILTKNMKNDGVLHLNINDVKVLCDILTIRPDIWNRFSLDLKKELLKNKSLLITYIASSAFSEQELYNCVSKKMDKDVESLYRLRKIGPYTAEGESQMLYNINVLDIEIYRACETMLQTCLLEKADSKTKNGEDIQNLMHSLPIEYSKKLAILSARRRYTLASNKCSENSEPERS